MLAGRHQSGNVRHVDEKNRADRIGNLPEPGKIESARISGRAGGNHRGPHLFGQFLQRVVIDLLGLLIDAVVCDLIKFAGEICRMPMAEMSSVREVHRQDFVARFNGGEIDCHVRLCAAMRLHIHVLAAKESFRAINRQLFSNIDILAPAIPALSGVTFGILVREHTTLRFHHCAAREILRGDQFDIFALPFFFRRDHIENLRIYSFPF